PIYTNEKLSYVDVFSSDGRQFFALRPASFGQDPAIMMDPNAAAWPPVQLALQGRTDPLGDKFAEFVDSRWVPLFVTAAPVWRDGRVVGAVAVSLPVDDLTQRLSQEAGSKGITLYRLDGVPLASTLRASQQTLTSALSLTPQDRSSAISGSQVTVRRSAVGDVAYVEALSALAVRREASLILGTGNVITIIQERAAETQRTMMLIFAALIVLVTGIGLMVARMINRPISTLLDA